MDDLRFTPLNIKLFSTGDGGEGGTPPPPPPTEPMIPKHRFDEVSRKNQEYEAAVRTLKAELEEAKAHGVKVTELEGEITKLKAGYEAEKLLAKKHAAVKDIVKDRVVDFDVLMTLLDLEKVTFDADGGAKGLKPQLKRLQTEKPYLWKPAEQVIPPSSKSSTKPEKTYAQKLAEKKKAAMSAVVKSKNYF